MAVPPGESGEVKVVFTPEFRQGTQKRPIAVQLADEKETRVALYLHVEIPEVIRPNPIFLRWGPEEVLAPKQVTIETDQHHPVQSMTVRPTNPLWDATVTPIANTRNYSLVVLPKARRGTQSQYIEVEAQLLSGHVKRTKVYVVVR
jgi:hypothetical protein